MENPLSLNERVTRLEYFAFEQLPPKMAAMEFATSQLYGLAQANNESLAGLRVDMAGAEARLGAEIAKISPAFKLALGLQGDRLAQQIATTRAECLTSMTAFRDRVDQRFERVDGQLNVLREDLVEVRDDVNFLRSDVGTLMGEVGTLKEDVGTLKEDVSGLKQDVGTINSKLDTLIAEIRNR